MVLHLRKQSFILILLIILMPVAAVSAQEDMQVTKHNDFWLCLGADTAMYSYLGLAYGGSFAFGYGSGSSFGLKTSIYFNEEGIDTLELCFIIRFYLFGADAYSGPFLQFLGGPSLYNRTGNFSIPSSSGMISAGLSFGWRFIFSDRFFVEPAIRGGYPYLFGATVSAGIRF